ncbi:phenylalanine-4-hydroxylase [Pedobacter sp. UYP30]|uniref:aromatic amino acid hydroxylase n=1 Tax=Pedobacter sp. UYP30 TaxID=1756400 RepID=UPI00339B0DA5
MDFFNDFNNRQVAKLPKHLKQFIVPQNYAKYTPVDQAVWRYVMRQNYSYLKSVAYYPYIKGLQKAGLTIEHIPNLQTMNDHLGKLGWGAVTVDGFIPPAAFMEYQAYKVLVIAADIRKLEHIEYTPAPDIIHESAGHAPIIADEGYNKYLSYFGSIGAKAMFSAKDFELYQAIRNLSILKEDINSTEKQIATAERILRNISENMGEPSEMALLSRLHWWTVEYGLIGTPENPKIYGAGLLSSIGESASCMQQHVKKLPYSIDTLSYGYDITQQQPQLFVTPNFQNLIDVLEEFADTMAFRHGGIDGIIKAIDCKNIATAVYSSGLQISGIFTDVGLSTVDKITFIKTTGKTALSFDYKELISHGKDNHQDGFSSPVGKLKNSATALENFCDTQLVSSGIFLENQVTLMFESGISVSGTVKNLLKKEKKLILITFEECTVTEENGNILFKPAWGVYDMAVGEDIVSVFNGAADKDRFEDTELTAPETYVQPIYTKKTEKLHHLYKQVRDIREENGELTELEYIFETLRRDYRTDWLCALEILELVFHKKPHHSLERDALAYLELKASADQAYTKLITDGIYIIKNPVNEHLTN